ncbi:unnamed protein product [Rotaria sordida]|uniref:Uncharacterized protein n=1 Tax=Rotaria sordida TaxID=392033 RepID=A0A813ZLC4_9BILA|nr:unnamed protein product [Rotaria sordida]
MVADTVAIAPTATTIDFAPLAGYDAKPAAAVDSQFFKSENGAQYQTSDKVPAVAADRGVLASGESPRINVAPATAENAGTADMLVGKDGTVTLAEGLAGKTLKEYNVQIEAGADAKLAERALSDLGSMIKNQSPDAVPRLNVLKGENGEDVISSEFRDTFRDKFETTPVDKTLPDGQTDGGGGGGGDCDGGGGGGGGGCDGGGGGGGGGGNDMPETDTTTDNTNRVDNGTDSTTTNSRAFNELAGKLSDMNAVNYGNWLASSMPDGFMEELGPPPWDPKKLAAYLSKHSKDIKDKMGKRASALDKQGDKEGAKAINDFADNFEKVTQDPARLDKFATAMSDFTERANNGSANPTDVHAMFDNNAGLEGAIRRSQMLESAKKFDTSLGGEADLTKLNAEKAAALIADLQRAPVAKVKPLEPFSVLPKVGG